MIIEQDKQIVYFDEATGTYKIFYDGKWYSDSDVFGKGIIPPKVAVVGTAIVGESVVGGNE